jgi:adenylate cyclase
MNSKLLFAEREGMQKEMEARAELDQLEHEQLMLQAEVARLRSQVGREVRLSQLLVRCAELMNSQDELAIILQRLLDLAIEFTRAERGFLALTGEAGQPLRISVVRQSDTRPLHPDTAPQFSQSIIDRVLSTGETLVTTDAQIDPELNIAESVLLQQIRSIICIPLKVRKVIIGMIYLDSRIMAGLFSQREPEVLSAFSALAGPVIEIARLANQFSRYLAPHVVESLVRSPHTIDLGGERTSATILFADIRGFTAMSSRMAPEAVVAMLNRYLEGAVADVFAQNGLLDKFHGDGFMAVFGAPRPQPDDAKRAVRTAFALQNTVDRLSRTTSTPFRISIGLATGSVVAGFIGSTLRMDYTVIGDAVNLASRLQAKAEPGTTLCDEATYLAAGLPAGGQSFNAGIRGRTEVLTLYRLKASATDASN